MGEIIYTEKEILRSNCKNKNHTKTAIRLISNNQICLECRQDKINEFHEKKLSNN